MSTKKYDVFISYRRDGGDATAKHIRDVLTERGYKVFLDVESLRNGPFNKALLQVIENSTDFLLILPPNGLDRCKNENDWVRQEIEHAKACNKNIVPVLLKGFDFPEELPESIDFIRYQSAPPNLEIYFFDAFMDKLESFLESRKTRNRRRTLRVALIALTVCILAAVLIWALFLRTEKPEETNPPASPVVSDTPVVSDAPTVSDNQTDSLPSDVQDSTTETAASEEKKPSKDDLDAIDAQIAYPDPGDYLDTYQNATVVAPHGHSVTGFPNAKHNSGGTTVLDGEAVVVLAEHHGYSCVIVLSANKAYWINSEYLQITESSQ